MNNNVIEFGDQLNTFYFKLSQKFDLDVIEVIGYGLVTMINHFFETFGKEEPSLWTIQGNDQSCYVIGDELANMYQDDAEFELVYKNACAELSLICASPEGEALERFLLTSVGLVDCFPMSSDGTLILMIKEGYKVNPNGTLGAVVIEHQEYMAVTKKLSEMCNGGQHDTQATSNYLFLPDY